MRPAAEFFTMPQDDEPIKPAAKKPGKALKAVKTISKSRVMAVKPPAQLSLKSETFLKERVAKAKAALVKKVSDGSDFPEQLKPTASNIEQRVLQAVLPLWDDDNRGVPNPFIRSGLFSVNNSQTRDFIPDMKIASLSNIDVTYRGEELYQTDLTVWMALINLARKAPLSEAIYFTGYQLISDCGFRMHSDSYRTVQESIKRLKVTSLSISTKGNESAYAGSLIRDYAWTENDVEGGNTKWMVRFEPRISALFMEDTTTLLQWEERKIIGPRAKLALWLHGFYFSHRGDPQPNTVSRLYELCRSKDSLSSFRRNLKTALTLLVERQIFAGFTVENDMVFIKKRSGPRLVSMKKTKGAYKRKIAP